MSKKRQGRCYELAGQWMLGHGKRDDTETKLVHGVVHSCITGVANPDVNHAWIVQGDKVWEPTRDLWWDKYSFYETFRAEDWATYTHQEMCKIIHDTEHWGPWDETA